MIGQLSCKSGLLIVLFLVSGCGGSNGPAEVDSEGQGPFSVDQSQGENVDGLWGAPESTFMVPFQPNGENGLYLPDVQASYPEVDWQNLDRLYLPAGHYAFINLGNLPVRSADNPLVISNRGGQVHIGGLGHYYLFVLGGGSNWVVTGRYDPVSATGDVSYQGHRGNQYEDTRDTYGILIDDDFVEGRSNSGLSIGGGATDFELSYIEVREVGFAGFSIKTDDNGDALMSNLKIHDNYIHDTKSEGVYIGSTQAEPQHAIESMEFYNNRVLRTGTEALQVGQLGEGNEIHHNVFGPAAIDWRDSFQRWQDSSSQIGVRYGNSSIHHNIFIGAANALISFFGQDRDADEHHAGDAIVIHDNHYEAWRSLGAFIGGSSDETTTYRFERNSFRNFQWTRDEIYPDESEPDHLFRTFNTSNPILLTDNRFEASLRLINRLASDNGVDDNIIAEGNVAEAVDAIDFNNSGFPPEFDYLALELWTTNASRHTGGENPSVYYQPGDYVMHNGKLYRSIAATEHHGYLPDDHPEIWELLGYPSDDVRLAPGSAHEGIGLLDTVE